MDRLSRGYPLPAAPVVAEATDGGVILVLYETSPGKSVMRAERLPDEESYRLGLMGGGPAPDVMIERLVSHVRDTFTGRSIPHRVEA